VPTLSDLSALLLSFLDPIAWKPSLRFILRGAELPTRDLGMEWKNQLIYRKSTRE
jgi:hypothetical protein